MNPKTEYLPDDRVDAATDEMLRDVLSTCFTKPQDVVFRERRYFLEPYPHRWVIRDEGSAIVAHLGVHEKQMLVGGRPSRAGGICEVCVRPDHRGRGYVRVILRHVHVWLSGQGFAFAILFGDPRVYGSSGYVQVGNLFLGGGEEGWTQTEGMVKELSGTPWPDEEVHLPGPEF